MKNSYTKESKCISYCLRHGAEKIGLKISNQGYVNVHDLIQQVNAQGFNINRDILDKIVAADEKGRYSYSHDKTEIRANQGHSIDDVKLTFEKKIPPVTLYHGTSSSALEGIKKTGIQRMKRHHVHLTEDINTASSVGMRHGSEVIIAIDTRDMVKNKIDFFKSENGVWLTNFVNIEYFKEIIRKIT